MPLNTRDMQTLVKVENKQHGFTFRTFYGRWQKKHAKDFINLMAENGIKCWLL
jgi:hypothetical protein